MWQKGLIVPDANILLHLLRYGQETRQEVLKTLRVFQPRVWVPYRVGFEFLRRWRAVNSENRSAYEKLKKGLRKEGATLGGLFNEFSRHQNIDAASERAKIESFIKELCTSLDEAAKTHPTIEEAESILDEIAELIGDAIGAAPTAEEMPKWVKAGAERYASRVPPGYMDEKNKDGEDKYGDYFIWEEMIAAAKARSSHVIFISDDRKEDWILRHDGRDIGPRPELVHEFAARTGQRFYSYPFRAFLERAAPYTKVEVSSGAIAEIEKEERHAERQEEERQEARRVAELVFGTSTPSAGNAIRSIGGRDSAEEGGLAEQITKAVDTTNLFRLVEAIEANKATLKRVAEGSSFAKAAQDLANAQSAYKNLFPDNSFSRKAKEFAEAQSAYKDLFPDNSVGKVVQGSAGRRATDNRALDSDKAATPGPDGGSPNSQPNDDSFDPDTPSAQGKPEGR